MTAHKLGSDRGSEPEPADGSAADTVLERARSGDPVALQDLYQAHASAVAARLLRLCADEDVARDLTHDTFVIALRRLDEFRGEGSVATWLHGIAYNVLRDHRRTQRRRRGLFARWFSSDAGSEQDEGEGPAAAVPLGEPQLLERLGKALQALDEDKRDAFVLRVIEGLSVEQCASVLGVAISTVSYRAKQAEAQVRAHFEEES